MGIEALKACRQKNCRVADDGKCLEGLETNECPHFYWNNDKTADAESLDKSEVPNESSSMSNIVKQPSFQLFPGTELDPSQITVITNKYKCQLVVILGEFDCGKTTLLSSIFDLFQIGYFKNYMFAGSLTQIGFEERSHLSRSVSGSEKPDTERTKSLEFRLLHLGVKKSGFKNISHLILSDISGETIRQARNSGAVMRTRLALVKKADHVVYMFDGEKLQPANRATTLFNAELFIQNALDNEVFDKQTVLNVLISKWDIISKDITFNMEDMLIKALDTRFKARLKDIKYSFIAARPDTMDDKMELGYGVEAFLDELTKPVPRVLTAIVEDSIHYERYFANFKMR